VRASYGREEKSSHVAHLHVKPNPNLEGLWAGFVEKMVKRDLDGAMLYFRQERRSKYRTSYERVGTDNLSAAYQTARDLSCYRIYMGEAEYDFTITINGTDCTAKMVFHLEPDGVWRIDTLGF